MNATAPVLPAVGTAIEGGFFVCVINIAGEHYGLVVAPKDGGEHAPATWNKSAKALAGARSYCDGHANTEAMAKAGSALAAWARGLELDGFTDWYLPSRDELELCYRHLKPGSEKNYQFRSGDNPSSVPTGYPYTDTNPPQTSVANFQDDGPDAFADDWYWSSTQVAGAEQSAWCQDFDTGNQTTRHKDYELSARAVRRYKL